MQHKKWNEKTPEERKKSITDFLGTVKGFATTLIALTFFARELGKK